MAELLNEDDLGIQPTTRHEVVQVMRADGGIAQINNFSPLHFNHQNEAIIRAFKNYRKALPSGLDDLEERVAALEASAYAPQWGHFSGESQGSFTPLSQTALTWGTFLSDGSGQVTASGDDMVLSTVGAYYTVFRVRIDPIMAVALSLTPSSTSTVVLQITKVGGGTVTFGGGSSIVYGYNGFQYEQIWSGVVFAQTAGLVLRTTLTINTDFSDATVSTTSWYMNYLGSFV